MENKDKDDLYILALIILKLETVETFMKLLLTHLTFGISTLDVAEVCGYPGLFWS